MTSTQFMSFYDIYIQDNIEILSRIVWYYDSSGVQAKNYYGSMYEPILFCVKLKKSKMNFSDNFFMLKRESVSDFTLSLVYFRTISPINRTQSLLFSYWTTIFYHYGIIIPCNYVNCLISLFVMLLKRTYQALPSLFCKNDVHTF